MSENEITIGLVTILVFGIGAQWIGRRSGIPSLLLLLPAGLLAGDVLGLVEPVKMFGDLLFPLITLLLSLLLFQSGLQLRVNELPDEARSSVARLVTIGLAITFIGGSLAAVAFLDVPNELAFMVGAILVVSGPTVVGPLLDVVRPKEPTGTVLLWEGTVLDPLGATLGVIVLNLILASDRGGVHPILQMLERVALGVTVGVVAAALLVFVMSRFLLTDNMQASVALLFATLAFGVANVILSEAGLIATVTMGIVAANQRFVSTRRISGFGDTLEVLIIGILFITLGALVKLADLWEYALPTLLIVLVLVLVVRPVTAAVSLWRTPLTGRDRAMVGWMDPRGIVAAATAAQFSESLTQADYDTKFLLPVVFGVIIGTGVIYGTTAKPVAALLKVARPTPKGVGLVGDDPWLVPFGNCLAEVGVAVLLITSDDRAPVGPSGEPVSSGVASVSVRSGTQVVNKATGETPLAKVVVSAGSDVITRLVVERMIEMMGRRHVLRVPDSESSKMASAVPERWSAEPFAGRVSRHDIRDQLEAGGKVELVANPAPEGTLLLAAVDPDGGVTFRPNVNTPNPGDTLIGVVGGTS